MRSLLFLFSLLITTLYCNAQPVMQFRNDSSFRIAQITDLHHKLNHPRAALALKNLGAQLDEVKPDLVVFTGDIVVDSAMKKAWAEVVALAVDRNIPWAVTLGNHDDEQGSTREDIMNYLTTLPLCLAAAGPSEISGIGNYYLRIQSSDAKRTAALLYALDSRSYSPKTLENGKYGYIDFSQVNWYREQSRQLTTENNGKPFPAVAFFHIPLREYGQLTDTVKYTRIGSRYEDECYGALNTGMYAAMWEAGDVMATFTGHDHVNDYIGQLNSICLAYGRFSGSTTTYGHLPNGMRIIELYENKRSFRSWIIDSTQSVVHPVVFRQNKLVQE